VAEGDAVCGGEYGTCSPERVNSRSGYRRRELDTRAGIIDVAIPKLREGSDFPDWLLERRNSQVSRMAADLDEQVTAFRTRPLDDAGQFTFVAADALTMKIREYGRVVNAVVLIATGVNADGHREVLEPWRSPPARRRRRGTLSSPTWSPAACTGAAGHVEVALRVKGDRRTVLSRPPTYEWCPQRPPLDKAG
jgi:transposase-like protein